jgi:peptidyl-prolyl cis-trans isomerase SurA
MMRVLMHGRVIVVRMLTILAAVGAVIFAQPVLAQNVVLTVNDSPITNYDIAQRIKLLGVLRLPASQQAATDSLIEDRLKLIETRKYGINPGEQDIANEAARDAGERKIAPQQLAAGLQRAGIDKSHWQEHWRAKLTWRILVQALNKSVSVSEEEVRAEMAKKGSTTGAQEFRIQQIILVVPNNATVAAYNGRFAEATGLRARFRDCNSGVQLARALRDVAVQPQIGRRANTLSAELVALFDRTPVGQLTPPQRGPTGVEMVAVCGKSDAGANSAASESIRDTLLIRKLQADADKRFADVRKRAVIVRR